jgi:DNA invertase Pin-like site-specific DNA recombinase
MLQYCKDHRAVKYAIFDEYDRFMRSVNEGAYFEVMFEQLGVKVWYASESDAFNGNDAMAKFMRSMSAFKAEGSNEERQRKSISGQTTALKEGRYTFNPKPGYHKVLGTRAGVHDIHPIKGPALKKVLIDIAERRVTPTQGLINLNKSEFMSDGHSLYKMDKFRKIATDPYYAGIVEINKQVRVRNEAGLHEALISVEQHEALIYIFNNKKKTQSGPRKNGNPEFPVSNMVHCDLCKETKTNGKYVGYNHGNGKNPNLVYQKYRCRGCNRYLSRHDVHTGIEKLFNDNPLTKEGASDVIAALEVVWRQEENQAEQNINRIKSKIRALKDTIERQIEDISNPSLANFRDDILASIAKKKEDVSDLQNQLETFQASTNEDKREFLEFAYDFIDSMGKNFLNTDLVSKENRLRCKNIIFPAGFYISAENKVYTPKISELYRLGTMKKDAEASSNSHLVRVKGL